MKQLIRFCFVATSAEGERLTSGGWRVWVNKDDIYLTAKSVADRWKVSLHGDRAWRLAVTREHHGQPDSVWRDPDRAPWKFSPTEFVDGIRQTFAVGVTRGALLPSPSADRHEQEVKVPDRWDVLGVVYLWTTEGQASLADREDLFAGPLEMAGGRRLWLTAVCEKLPAGDPEPPSVSTMIEPLWPEKHGVPVPGLLVRGVHVG